MQTTHPITKDEHTHLLAHEKNPQFQQFLEFLWETGVRPQDIVKLTAESVENLATELVYIPGKSAGFHSEAARIPITLPLASLLEALPESGPLFPNMDFHPDDWSNCWLLPRCNSHQRADCQITKIWI